MISILFQASLLKEKELRMNSLRDPFVQSCPFPGSGCSQWLPSSQFWSLLHSLFNLSLCHILEKNQIHQYSSIIVLIAITSGHSGRNVLVHHILWGFDFFFNHRKKPNTKPNSQPFPYFQCHDRRLVPPDPASWAQLPEETSLESFVCWTRIFFDVLRCADLICEL